jgi:hypothetical protein
VLAAAADAQRTIVLGLAAAPLIPPLAGKIP